MCKFFAERGSPSSIVTSALERVRNIDRETALKPTEPKTEERILFTLTSRMIQRWIYITQNNRAIDY